MTEDRQIVARYAPEKLTVKFFLTGGTNGPEDQEVLYGGKAKGTNVVPERDGYDFIDWYAEPSGGKPFDFDTPLYADTVLYAGWKEKEYSITLAEGTQVEQLLINGELREGNSWAALPGDLVEVRFASTPRPLSLRVTQSDGVWIDLTPYADGNGWSCLFNMSECSVTLSAQYEAAGTLKIEAESEVMEYLLYSASGMYLGSENESQVPVGTYTLEVWLSDGQHCRQENVIISQGQTTTVMIQSQTRHTVTFQVVSEPNPSLPVGLTLSVYGMGTGGDRMYYVDAVSVQNGEASISLPDGQYFLAASSGQISESTKTFTVSGQSVSHSVTLEWGMDIQLDLRCTNGWVSGTAYLQVESKLANGEWAIMYATSVGTSGTFLLEGVIMERDWEYRLRLVELYDQRGIQQQTVSEPVKFDPNAGGKVYLTYQLQQNNIPNFSGEGNGVLLSRGSAYPGDTVELIVRYNGTVAPEAFAVRLPDGLTDLNGTTSLTLTPDGEKQGTVRAMLKVADTAQRGNYSIPVTVTAGGKNYDFSAAVLTVDRPTLSGPAMAKAGESFNVYGEAPEGSKVTIRGASGKVYAIVVSSGRFYSGTVTLSGTDTLIGEVAVGSAAVQTNELEVMVTEEQPLALETVSYGSPYGALYVASRNSKLDSYLFNQYVDMELKGFDLRFSASFNREDVDTVSFRFCGQSYQAYPDGYGSWMTTFSRGTWGGAGLKEVTAQVSLYNGSTYELPVAIINLLVDPSGVITDENGQPLEGVTVLCQVWDETANGWKDLDAAAIGQTNPQVTDSQGRYGWYVPEGKYRVLAFKEGYLDYDSSLHAGDFEPDWDGTIPPARTDINFSMTPAKSTYTVYPTAVTGGTVAANAASAEAGQSVTLTVTPEEGLRVSSVTVRTLSGTSVPIAREAENTYTFTMPYADVTYSAAFSGTQQTSVSIASADADGQVSVTIRGLLENARLMAAYYDKDGRMLGVDVQEVKAGTGTVQMNVPVSGTAVKVSVFLLDHEQKPLVPSTDRQLN